MRALGWTLLPILLLAPAQVLADDVHVSVVRDLFVAPPLEAFSFEGGCGVENARFTSGAFELDHPNRTFRFVENAYGDEGEGLVPDGQLQTTCGTASIDVQVPSGTEHVHVRFQGERTIHDVSTGNQPPNAVQELQARVGGHPFYMAPYVPRHAGDIPLQAYDPPPLALPAGATRLEVAWYFADDGAGLQQDVNNVASAHAFSASVVAPVLEFSGLPVPAHVRTSDLLADGEAVLAHDVTAKVTNFDLSRGPGHLRFLHAKDLVPVRLELPNGTLRTTFPTADALPHDAIGGPFRHAGIEHDMVVVPASMVEEAGAGTYRLVLESRHATTMLPAVATGSYGMLALPLFFAAMAHRGIDAFQRQAFGRFVTGARALKQALWLTVAFYGAVVAAAWTTGDLRMLGIDMARRESVLLYIQVALATAAFLGLWAVGRRLEQITRPTALPED